MRSPKSRSRVIRSRSRISSRKSCPRSSGKVKYVRSRLTGKCSPQIVERSKLKKGSLTSLGYAVKSPVTSRNRSLRKAVKKYGKASTVWKLNLQATYRKRSDPRSYKSIKRDVKFVQSLKD
jgi:hypothetical protein